MPFTSKNGLQVFQFTSFYNLPVYHGLFTRGGGVSPAPWDSLNLGGTVGDTRENVIENRRRIFDVIGYPVQTIHDVWQVHSTDVLCIDRPRDLSSEPIQADAIITNGRNITLFMRFADCVPILIYDHQLHVAGIIHAGWQGTVGSIAQKTVEAMTKCHGCDPSDLVAGIGPSIGPDHYQVGEDVVNPVKQLFRPHWDDVLECRNGSWYFDLWRANEILLRRSGVQVIEQSNECTACHTQRWYSHRAEKGRTGRFAGLIGLVDHG